MWNKQHYCIIGFLNLHWIQTLYIFNCLPLFTCIRRSTKFWTSSKPASTNSCFTNSKKKKISLLAKCINKILTYVLQNFYASSRIYQLFVVVRLSTKGILLKKIFLWLRLTSMKPYQTNFQKIFNLFLKTNVYYIYI